jgi:purine-nucleoside phosphorylase
MSRPYSTRLAVLAKRIAREHNITLNEGVYVAVPGPQFETRAEYRYLRAIGADVVGMSTVPEVIVAVHMGLEVLAVSVMTDDCDPDKLEPMNLQDILDTAAIAEKKLTKLFLQLLTEL